MALRILLVGGGSIGHVAPLVAVWRAIQALHPDAQATVICADRPEELEFCRAEKLDAVGLPRLRMNAGLPRTFIRASSIADGVLREFHPDIIFCKGGSLSIPVCRIARRMGIPIVLHESDAVMGRANRVLSRWADTVCLGIETSDMRHEIVNMGHETSDMRKRALNRSWTNSRLTSHVSRLVTGNPVRPEITHGNRKTGLGIAGFSGKKPVVIVCGGSQGAKAINDAVAVQLPILLKHCDVIHLTGPGKQSAKPQAGYFSLPFAQHELAHLYAASDIAVSRAGAGTMSELNACGIPMMLIPIRGLAQDHQWLNAQAMMTAGCAEIVEQQHIAQLSERVVNLLNDAPRRARMSEAGKHAAGEAAGRIAKIIADSVASGGVRA